MPRQYAEPHHQSSTSSSVHLDTNQANTRFIKRNSPSLQELLPTSFEGSPPDIELTPPADPVHDDTMKHTVYLTICTPRPFLGTDDDRPTFHHQSSPRACSSKDTGTVPLPRYPRVRYLYLIRWAQHSSFATCCSPSHAVHVDVNDLCFVRSLGTTVTSTVLLPVLTHNPLTRFIQRPLPYHP
jgi:hypothetical protein